MTVTAKRLMNRKLLLDAARGLSNTKPSSSSSPAKTTTSRPLKCFPLRSNHVKDAFSFPTTPTDFHSLLCDKIRNSKQRVLLASLYVGPAASAQSAPREQDLLDALQVAAAKPNVQVKVIMDKNRALRPIPLSSDANAKTTSSAQAVLEVLNNSNDEEDAYEDNSSSSNNNNLFLFSVLPASLQYFLPNPFNEVAGVFHIKVYIIDDSLILSGANLSEEYFVDRHDRYCHITEGGGGLVDFYGDLVKVLCDHSELYYLNQAGGDKQEPPEVRNPTTRTKFIQDLNDLLTTTSTDGDDKTVAVAVPTFQAPEYFFSEAKQTNRCFSVDTEVTESVLQAAVRDNGSSKVQLSSAYLNPTENLLRVLSDFESIEFLTAGRISHGFTPKKKAGNKGRPWIPSLFEKLSQEAFQRLERAKVLYYERPGWTFHAKGLWLSESSGNRIAAAICGSGNYGARSETLDMESNCVLILPPDSPLQEPLQEDWANMLNYTKQLEMVEGDKIAQVDEGSTSADTAAPLSWPLQVCLPVIRKFL